MFAAIIIIVSFPNRPEKRALQVAPTVQRPVDMRDETHLGRCGGQSTACIQSKHTI